MTLTQDWTLLLDMTGLPGFREQVPYQHTACMRPLQPEMAQWIVDYTAQHGKPPSRNSVLHKAGELEGATCCSLTAKRWIKEALR